MRLVIVGYRFSMVDDQDFERISLKNWSPLDGGAIRRGKFEEKTVTIYMHREILGIMHGDKRQVDHLNGNRLDNRRKNLRICSHAQNLWNRGRTKRNKSGFKGVCRHSQCPDKWTAEIRVHGRRIYLGLFDTPELAFEAYQLAAHMLHGEFARTE